MCWFLVDEFWFIPILSLLSAAATKLLMKGHDMKPSHTKRKAIKKDANQLLAEAMKQPGVGAAMEVFESTDKYSGPVTQYNSLVEWQRFLTSFSSCDTSSPA